MEKEKYKDPYKRVELPKEEKMDFFHLNCPSCNAEVPAADINIHNNTAKCSTCDALFSFENSFPEPREELKKPVEVEKYYFNDELELAIPEPMSVIDVVVLSLFPFIVLLGGLLYYKKGGFEIAIGTSIIALILAYSVFRALRTRKNKVSFIVGKDQVEILRPPNSVIKSKQFTVSEIEQIYTTRTHNGIALKAILNTPRGQEHKIMIDYMKSVMVAKYVEQEIEKQLNIPNKKVSNEIE